MTTVAQTATLVHGYTMADVERLATTAARRWAARNLDVEDAYDAAWFGVVELLYDSVNPPGERELWWAGYQAAAVVFTENLHHRGITNRTYETGPSFAKYWLPPRRTTYGDEFSYLVDERLALPSILAQLTDLDYETLAALAAIGSQAEAADALGLSGSAFRSRLFDARKRAKVAWFAPEQPPSAPTTGGTGNDQTCRHGHSRAEHAYRYRGSWRCRRCARNEARRARARGERRGSTAG